MNKTGHQSANEARDTKEEASNRKGLMKWLKRLGIAGFLFFLIKGILWLTVGAAVIRYLGCEG
jgi:hypothetical protein